MKINFTPPSPLYNKLIERLSVEIDPSVAINSDYLVFQEKYFYDPVNFALDCISWSENELAFYQMDAMRMLIEHGRISIRGPHGLGKTAISAIIILWFALTRDGRDWKIPTLASSWRQVEKYLWPEVHKWSKRLRWDKIGREHFDENRELLTLNLKLNTGFAFGMASSDEGLIEGAHADYILYIFDESKSIPNAIWDAVEGALSTGIETFWFAVSTPGEPNGRFYDIQSRKAGYEDWKTFHVTLEMAIKARRVDPKWAANRKQQWGENSTVYQNRVLGNFAASEEDAVIPLSWIEKSNTRWLDRQHETDREYLVSIGVDVGRGGDPSVIAERWGHDDNNDIIRTLHRFHFKDIMPLVGRFIPFLKKHKKAKAIVDVTGLGAGAVDRGREIDNRKYEERILAFIAGGKTEMMDESGELGFIDMRSAAYWLLRERLGNDKIDLPPDDKLTGDLSTPRYEYRSNGKIKVESKKEIKKRLGRSTDDGDAVSMAFMDEWIIPTEEITVKATGSNYLRGKKKEERRPGW